MTSIQIASNPFAQMMDPQAVIAAVERSVRLQCLQSRVCRPLDKPLATAEGAGDDATLETAADDEVDGEAVEAGALEGEAVEVGDIAA